MTVRLAVIGHPIAHSLSPIIHRAALAALNTAATYDAIDVPPEALASFLEDLLVDQGWRGCNVTTPLKEAVMASPLVGVRAESSVAVGAVNTLVVESGHLTAHNTDVDGFVRGLAADLGVGLAGEDIVVLGAGGSARAVVWACLRAAARRVTVVNRSLRRAADLVTAFAGWSGTTSLEALASDAPVLATAAANASLLVNCTTVGMAGGPAPEALPIDAGLLHPDLAVYDLVYRPAETPLVREARGRGARAVSGLSMLVHQAAASLQLWFPNAAEPDVEAMTAAARAALAGG